MIEDFNYQSIKEYWAGLDKKLFLNLLFGTYVVLSLIFIIAIFLFDYELTNYDIPGTILASPLVAHLLYLFKKEGTAED